MKMTSKQNRSLPIRTTTKIKTPLKNEDYFKIEGDLEAKRRRGYLILIKKVLEQDLFFSVKLHLGLFP